MGIYDSPGLILGGKSARFIQLQIPNSSQNSIDHDIRGKLAVFDLSNAPDYDALSYTWGGPGRRIDIQLNDQPFSISQNLYDALKQLAVSRHHSGAPHRRIWIDAICINQTDNEEKSKQVMQMTEIYARAKRVLLWLGASDNFTALAFDTLRCFAQEDGTTDGSTTYRNLVLTLKERVEAVRKLSERPYFSRVWVIQEAVAAQVAIVLCGSESMDLTDFSRAFNRVTGSTFFPHSLALNVIAIGNWRNHLLQKPGLERDNALDLQMLLMYSRDRLCKDNRDKVYALRGIGTQRFAEGVIVDYSDTVEQVYIKCAKHWLTIRSDLRVLSTVEPRHSASTTLKLPSWVPDWSQPNHHSGVMQRYFRFLPEYMFRAAGHTAASVTFDHHSDMVSIKGNSFDTIEQVVSVKSSLRITDSEPTLLTPTRFKGFVEELSSKIIYNHTGESFTNAVLRTVTADRTGLSSRVADNYRNKYLTSYSSWRLRHDSSIFELPDDAWKELSSSTAQILDDKDMLVTEKGYIGIARSGFRSGDLVCVFLGGEVPFIVRQLDHDSSHFRFMGECYVHGIMDGEAMQSGCATGEEVFQLI